MKNKIRSQPKPAQAVLEVTSVCACQPRAERGKADVSTIHILQDAGFQGLRQVSDGVYGRSPGGDMLILLIIGEMADGGLGLPCELMSLCNGQITTIDAGETTFVQSPPSAGGNIEVRFAGEAASHWKVSSTAASADAVHLFTEASESVVTEACELQPQPEPAAAPLLSPPPGIPEGLPEGFITALVVRTSQVIAFQPQTDDPTFSGQPRKWFDGASLQRLGESMRDDGQQLPIIVKPISGIAGIEWEIVDGERRWRAAKLVGLTTLFAILKPSASKQAQHLSAMILNCNKAEFTPLEYSNGLWEQMQAGATAVSLAHSINKSLTTVNHLLALQKLHPGLRKLIDPPTPKGERISIVQGAKLSRVPMERQIGIWDQVKNEPTNGLVMAKLDALCRPHIVYVNIRRKEKRDNPSEISKRVDGRLRKLEITLVELGSATPDELVTYSGFKGEDQSRAILAKLTELEHQVLALKQRFSRAKANAKTLKPQAIAEAA